MSKADEEINTNVNELNVSIKTLAGEGDDETAEKKQATVQKQQKQLTAHPVSRDKRLIAAHMAEVEENTKRKPRGSKQQSGSSARIKQKKTRIGSKVCKKIKTMQKQKPKR